jgi:hypothetical protein
MIKLPKGIQENLQFLCVEIDSQLASLQLYFDQESSSAASQILERAGYAENLQARIHSGVVNQLTTNHLESRAIFSLRSIEFIANDLTRIAEICRNCVVQTESFSSFDGLVPKVYNNILRQVQKAVKLVVPAIEHVDSKLAIEIGQINLGLEQVREKLRQKNITAIKRLKNAEHMAIAASMGYEFKQMSAALVHICESIISANLGQPVSFDHYAAMQAMVEEMDGNDERMQIEAIAETRSGAFISGISSQNNGSLGIYKGGQKQKLKEEKDGVKNWHEIYPGLAPKILSYKKRGGSASLLIEHLSGYTFEKVVLGESAELLEATEKKLHKTLSAIWTETKIEKSADAAFIRQLQKRLPEVYKIHPEFFKKQVNICGQTLLPFDTLLSQAAVLEKQWPSAFSVYIHGDFNVDNIIYDPAEKRINFIDLHRSCYMDYVQDVSVFMVSNYRLQVIDTPSRQRLMAAASNLYAMARRYAVKHHDESFELRLALGLARSFATSTRFILDKSLARDMFLRARYLIELALAVKPENVAKFRLPLKEIFVE